MRIKICLAIILTVTLLAGCTRPQLSADLPPLPTHPDLTWQEAVSVNTSHYAITTNTDQAATIGSLMEAVYTTADTILGPTREHDKKLTIYAYASRSDYEQRVKKHGLPGRMTTGFYTPADPAGIHLPIVATRGVHPYFTLVHEGLHQYVHEILGYRLEHNGTESPAKLSPAPLWLNEGLALYFEAALSDATHLHPGRIHPARLAHLQQLLQRGKAPSVAEVINKSYGEPFTNANYSVAWGLVHAMRENQAAGPDWEQFWRIWQRTIQEQAEVTRQELYKLEPLLLQQEWAKLLAQQSTRIFQDQVLMSGKRWEEWETMWQAYILSLQPTP